MHQQELVQLPIGNTFSGVTLLLVDRSISMSYGFGFSKLEMSKKILYKIHGRIGMYGVLLFDHIVDEALSIGAYSDVGELEKAIGPISARGTTALSTAFQRALEILNPIMDRKRIVLLSDGRLNFSLNGTINECDSRLQEEALREARRAAEEEIRIDCVALGEDCFIWLLDRFSKITEGLTYMPDFRMTEEESRLTNEVKVHGIPEELPAGRPTWAKELDSEHLVVASEKAFSLYTERRKALLINDTSGKMLRVPLFSIEEEVLKTFRDRRGNTAESVRKGEAVLVDSANRKALDVKPGDTVILKVF
ncbi:MAG: VWA domain-containing protein [Thermoproteota archaeon]